MDTKVDKVLVKAGGGISEGVWAGEGQAVDEFGPGAALGEGAINGVGEVGEADPKGREATT